MESRLIMDSPAPGTWNMAMDEVLLEQAAGGAPPCLRFYRWSEPTLSLGYFQSVEARSEHGESRDVPLVRRSTGGGAILHHHELTYSWTCPASHRSTAASQELYQAFHETARELLKSLGIQADLIAADRIPVQKAEPFLCFQRRSEGDLVVGPHKVLGSAQRRRHGALLQHGSLLLETSDRAPQLAGLAQLGAKPLDLDAWCLAWVTLLAKRLGVHFSRSEIGEQEHWRAELLEAEKFKAPRWNEKR